MKKLVLFVLAISLLVCSCASGFAESKAVVPTAKAIKAPYCPTGKIVKIPVGNAEYVDIGNGKTLKISDLPSFESQAQANAYIADLKKSFSEPTLIKQSPRLENALDAVAAPKAKAAASSGTNGNVCVATGNFYRATVKLFISYSTSGAHNTGSITSHSAYTSFSGFTLGLSWHQNHCTSRIVGTKDIRAECQGEVVAYMFVEGLLELARCPVYLAGTAYAVK